MESPPLGERPPPIWHPAFLVDMTNEGGLGWRFKMISEAIVTIAHQRNVVGVVRTVLGGHGPKCSGLLELGAHFLDRVRDRQVGNPLVLFETMFLAICCVYIDFEVNGVRCARAAPVQKGAGAGLSWRSCAGLLHACIADDILRTGSRRLAGILLNGEKIGPPAACEMRWGFAARVFKGRACFRAGAF